MLARVLVLVVAGLGATAPAAVAQRLAGSTWATSPLGHMAFVAEDEDTLNSTLRLVAPTGEVGRPEALAAVGDTPSVAVGARGDVIVVWADRGGRLWARFRPPGGAFGRPEPVAPESSEITEGIPVAIDASGVAVLAWGGADGALRVRLRDPVSGWGAEQRLGGHDVSRPQLAVAGSGTAVLAWGQRGPSGLNSHQIAVSMRVNGAAFERPQVIAGPAGNPDSAVVAANARGDAAVAWIDLGTHPTFTVRAAFARAGAGFGRPVTLSRDEATGPTVAVQPSGRMILAGATTAHTASARGCARPPGGSVARGS